jgi:hypothetical protein
MQQLIVALIVIAAAAYAARALLPARWLPPRLRRTSSAAGECSNCPASPAMEQPPEGGRSEGPGSA